MSAYGADKSACELHARVAGAVHEIPTVGLRFFNLYGPRQDAQSPYSGVIALFADRLRLGEPVEIFGDGGQIRDFTYVGDAVGALDRALAAASTSAPVFNICTGKARACGPSPKPWLSCTKPISPHTTARHDRVKSEYRSEIRVVLPSSSALGPRRRWQMVWQSPSICRALASN